MVGQDLIGDFLLLKCCSFPPFLDHKNKKELGTRTEDEMWRRTIRDASFMFFLHHPLHLQSFVVLGSGFKGGEDLGHCFHSRIMLTSEGLITAPQSRNTIMYMCSSYNTSLTPWGKGEILCRLGKQAVAPPKHYILGHM